MTTKLLGPLLRHCGENPSEAEVQVLAEFLENHLKQCLFKFCEILLVETNFCPSVNGGICRPMVAIWRGLLGKSCLTVP